MRMGKFGASKQRAKKGTLKRLLNLVLYKNKLRLIIVVIAMIVATFSYIAATYSIQFVLKEALEIAKEVAQFGSSAFRLGNIPGYIAMIIAFYASNIIFTFTHQRLMIDIGQGTLNRMREDLFVHMTGLPLEYYDTNLHGDLMSRFTNDVDATRQLVSQALPQLVVSVLTLSGYIIAMGVISWQLLIISIITIFIILFFSTNLIKSSKGYFINTQVAVGKLNGYIEEMIEGQKVVKVFRHEKQTVEEFIKISEELRYNATKGNIRTGMLNPITVNISFLNVAITALFGAFLYQKNYVSIDQIIVFMVFIRNLNGPMHQISQNLSFFSMALAGASRVFDVMDVKSEVDNGHYVLVNAQIVDEKLVEVEENNLTHIWAWKNTLDGSLIRLEGKVEFDHVDFGYSKDKLVLKDVSLYAKPGQKIAFVGATGAGKTTITNLINRFYDIEKGSIIYDGINVKDIKKDSLRQSLGMVLQDTSLFSDTVENNIRYGCLDATREEIIEAAKLANAHEFILKLPEGYQTMLTDNASNLSQGQRQLLSIARAAVADPPVLILDEATSSIDTYTEKLIEEGMDKLMMGRTVFVIAHRLSTIKNAKAIIVLQQGEIIERGNHQDLINLQGNYYQLYTGLFELE